MNAPLSPEHKIKACDRQMTVAAVRVPRVGLTECKSAAGPIEPAPTQINVSSSQPAIVPPTRSSALIGLSAAFAG